MELGVGGWCGRKGKFCLLQVLPWRWCPLGKDIKCLLFLSRSFCEFLRDAPAKNSISNVLLRRAVNTPESQAPGPCWVFALAVGSPGGFILRWALPGQRKNSTQYRPCQWMVSSPPGQPLLLALPQDKSTSWPQASTFRILRIGSTTSPCVLYASRDSCLVIKSDPLENHSPATE